MSETKVITARIETEWYISFIRDNGSIFAKQWEEFYQKYSSEYDIKCSVGKYTITLIASLKTNVV